MFPGIRKELDEKSYWFPNKLFLKNTASELMNLGIECTFVIIEVNIYSFKKSEQAMAESILRITFTNTYLLFAITLVL